MDEAATVFTRSSNNLAMGIVGLPNVGKSTLFNHITGLGVPASNYPFCTIDPAEGVIAIPDTRLDFLRDLYCPKSIVPAYLRIVDIAGLIKGASEGEGLGNAFLDHIRSVDGIFHVVRCFPENEVLRADDVDPLRDIATINEELRLKDLQIMARLTKKALAKDELRTCEKVVDALQRGWVRDAKWSPDEVKFIISLNLLTTKNVVHLANIGEAEYAFLKDRSSAVERRALCLRYLKQIEHLKPLPFTKDRIGVAALVQRGYKALGLVNFFTAGRDECRSWTIRGGTPVNKAGAVIHSDFVTYFVTAEVIEIDALVELGSEAEVRKAGKAMFRGKGYVVKDGDIVVFKANPTKKKK